MTQLWALTVDSGWLPGGPMLREGGGARRARWDVITPCNLEEIHWAAHSRDESAPLVPSLHSRRAPLLAKAWKGRFREPILPGWCPPGVSPGTISNQLQPWSHVLSPRSGTTDRQSDCPSSAIWPRRSQLAHNSPEILLSGKGAQWSLCWGLCLYPAVSLSLCLTPSRVTLSPLTSLQYLNLRRGGNVF